MHPHQKAWSAVVRVVVSPHGLSPCVVARRSAMLMPGLYVVRYSTRAYTLAAMLHEGLNPMAAHRPAAAAHRRMRRSAHHRGGHHPYPLLCAGCLQSLSVEQQCAACICRCRGRCAITATALLRQRAAVGCRGDGSVAVDYQLQRAAVRLHASSAVAGCGYCSRICSRGQEAGHVAALQLPARGHQPLRCSVRSVQCCGLRQHLLRTDKFEQREGTVYGGHVGGRAGLAKHLRHALSFMTAPHPAPSHTTQPAHLGVCRIQRPAHQRARDCRCNQPRPRTLQLLPPPPLAAVPWRILLILLHSKLWKGRLAGPRAVLDGHAACWRWVRAAALLLAVAWGRPLLLAPRLLLLLHVWMVHVLPAMWGGLA